MIPQGFEPKLLPKDAVPIWAIRTDNARLSDAKLGSASLLAAIVRVGVKP